jgi:hypothetical protein
MRAYVAGCALVPAGLLAYLAGHHALAAAFDDVVRFTVRRYAAIQSVPFGFIGYHSPLTYMFPLAALLMLLVCAREWHTCFRDRLFVLCVGFGLAGFLGCFPRPDIAHIAFAAPLVCPLLANCVSRLSRYWRPAWWRYRYPVAVFAGVVIGLCAPSGLYFLLMSQQALRSEIVKTPRGGVAIVGQLGAGAPELLKRIATTPSGDAYFFYPTLANVSFLAARKQVSKYDVFMPGYTLPSQYHDACISVMRHASWVALGRPLDRPQHTQAEVSCDAER